MTDADTDERPRGPLMRWLIAVEHGISVAILALMVVLPVIGVLARWFTGQSLAGLNLWVQSLNLWIAFAGAAIAARVGRHLALSTGELLKLGGRTRDVVSGFTTAVATAVTALLAYASVGLVRAEFGSNLSLSGGVPVWLIQCAMPLGFLVMAIRLAIRGNRSWAGRGVALLAVVLAGSLALLPEGERTWVAWVGSATILASVALGAPIYTAMGGLAMLLFFGKPLPVPITAVPAETYRIVASPTLPTIPLFTLAGYLLAEGGASRRLVALFRTWFGWVPGGTAAAAVLVCAFFTTFTGASGVTILALGGLLLPILLKAGYPNRFAIGLIAASGSIGLLFPPSLPVILYGVVSHEPIDQLYVAGAVPGALLIGLLMLLCLTVALRHGVRRETLDARAALGAVWKARFEVLLPVLILVGIFGGFMTIFEAAAFTAAYAFLIEVVIHRDLHIVRDVPRVFVQTATLIGGVLIILGVALGFTSYLVDAEIPMQTAAWVEANIGNKLLFILMLNVFLLGVGCLMDIYSAIMVVVPLIVPIGLAFGMNPQHLGILFLANLELGFLTPPVGMNLFLASYRFDQPLTTVYRMALPFLGVLALGVLLIAYVPGMTTWAYEEGPGGPGFEDLVLEEDEEGVEPTTPLEIPEGVDLMQLLMEADDDSAAP